MSEFTFEGGSRGGPSAMDHMKDRQNGMPRVCAALAAPHMSLVLRPAKVSRVSSDDQFASGEFVGDLPATLVASILTSVVVPPRERELAVSNLVAEIRKRWGGGRYLVSQVRGGHEYSDTFLVPSSPPVLMPSGCDTSLPPEPGPITLRSDGTDSLSVNMITSTTGGMGVLAPMIGVGATVWLELSRSGPFKVVGKYEHPGASVKAHHPQDAPNEFERVRVNEDLWLCQDARGVVHILAAGSLTLAKPASRFGLVSQATSWAWGKRELVLWASIVGMAAKLAL